MKYSYYYEKEMEYVTHSFVVNNYWSNKYMLISFTEQEM